VTQLTISCAVELLRLTSDDINKYNDVIVEKVINIDQNSRSQTAVESVWSASKLSTESVGSRRELVTNCVHTPDADATQLDSCVASAVCIWLNLSLAAMSLSLLRTAFSALKTRRAWQSRT